jgi:hypothetical protein
MTKLVDARRDVATFLMAACLAACAGSDAGVPAGAAGAGGGSSAGSAGSSAPAAGASGTTASGAAGSGAAGNAAAGSGGAGSGASGTGASGSGGAGSGAAGRGAAGMGAAGAGAAGAAGSGARDAGASPGDAASGETGACSASADPLKTNNARNDAYDCTILDVAARYGHPDPMMLKAQVQQESSFQIFSTSPDSPCGTHAGWTDAESKSFGLIQVTPACGEAPAALLPDGHPNLTMDMTSAMWATSVFNPSLNLGEGAKSIAGSLKALRAKYAGCTDAEYVLMSAGAFNSGDNAVTGCAMFNARAQSYVNAVLSHYASFAKAAGWPNPY